MISKISKLALLFIHKSIGPENDSVMLICELIFSLDSELNNKIIFLRPTTVFVFFYFSTCLPR